MLAEAAPEEGGQAAPGYDGRMDQPPRGRRVAFFGGSFDPPHQGHLAVARAAMAALDLDTVLFAPVGAQPLKPQGASAGFAERVAMVGLAIADDPAFAISLVDAPKASAAPNYTIDTLLKLRIELGADGTLFCLMGADSFLSLHHWHRAAEIPFVAPLIVASRPAQPLDDLRAALPGGLLLEPEIVQSAFIDKIDVAAGELRVHTLANAVGATTPFYVLAGLDVDVSASRIREAIHTSEGQGRRANALPGSEARALKEPLVACAVMEYIGSHGLYR
jgi:nicotinate-nucleotide adenylyltransferase